MSNLVSGFVEYLEGLFDGSTKIDASVLAAQGVNILVAVVVIWAGLRVVVQRTRGVERGVWVLVCLLLPVLGSLIAAIALWRRESVV